MLTASQLSIAEIKSDEAYEALKSIEIYAMGPTGISGSTSQGEKYFWSIYDRPDALHHFERLFKEGNIQAKSYALTGLYLIDKKQFDARSISYVNEKSKVEIMEGCIVSHKSAPDLLKDIQSEEYKAYLKPPKKQNKSVEPTS